MGEDGNNTANTASIIGKPKHFDLEHALEFVRQLVSADEVITALDVLDKFPAYYRDHPTPSMLQARENIAKRITTIQDYCTAEDDLINTEQVIEDYLSPKYDRLRAVEQLVEHWNKNSRTPHIVDFGPAQYWLPLGLKAKELKFSYWPITITGKVHPQMKDELKEHLTRKPEFAHPQIFVATEVIEHMFRPEDLYDYYCRENLNAEHIVISTPKYCLGGGWDRTNAEMIAHIRTWTPNELMTYCSKLWPQYQWQFMDGPTMLAVASRINQ